MPDPDRLPVSALIPENKLDFNQVALCFQDPSITNIFTELLCAMNIPTSQIEPDDLATCSSRIITEGQYLRLLPPGDTVVLVVGAFERSLRANVNVQALSRPLTEQKIEEALRKFLA